MILVSHRHCSNLFKVKGQDGLWASGQTQEYQLSCREKRKTCSLLRPQQERSGNEGFPPSCPSPGLLSSQCPEPSSLRPRKHQGPCLPPKYLNYLSLAGLLSYLAAKWLLLKEAEAVIGVTWLSGLCICSQFEFQPTIRITLIGYSNRTEAN